MTLDEIEERLGFEINLIKQRSDRMEILVIELSKLLNITIEKAVELFPIIQKEFIYYKIVFFQKCYLSLI